MEYLNDLSEIPTTAKAIIEQGGISFIKNYLKEENKVGFQEFWFFLQNYLKYII